jgi:DNA-binding PadR family transcriptional regulator
MGDSLISWSSKKQSVVALSTCEAEYYALTEGGKEAIHLNRLVWEIQNQRPVPDDEKLPCLTLFCDNQSTIFVAKNPAEHKMIKHIDLRHKWIQERVERGDFEVGYVSTKEQVADIFTKPLSRELFTKFRTQLNILKLPILRGSVEI